MSGFSFAGQNKILDLFFCSQKKRRRKETASSPFIVCICCDTMHQTSFTYIYFVIFSLVSFLNNMQKRYTCRKYSKHLALICYFPFYPFLFYRFCSFVIASFYVVAAFSALSLSPYFAFTLLILSCLFVGWYRTTVVEHTRYAICMWGMNLIVNCFLASKNHFVYFPCRGVYTCVCVHVVSATRSTLGDLWASTPKYCVYVYF